MRHKASEYYSIYGINKADEKGYTTLHLAAIEANDEMVKQLIESGADINAPTSHGSTPLHKACTFGNVHTAKL
ncbi:MULTISPECIES: ankyrin repeat domain-containing protein [unclassified Brenneria]|uniref:ankyrin repeat domain-containing protein n=1 Tax=unclassified Brenneria TaxID=2634434 RepID=UPI0018F0E4E2|nr:ankyrin repeat domain-containing protein [Brenneria sp. L3-3C-1]MBJ7221432.1 ankyrin repeat domain-containing protein [Brenneria sp. L3-3C-1]MEE3642675.1 ankyrin repeat domain-containing protein [Brenneria sp. L3_3C_1]